MARDRELLPAWDIARVAAGGLGWLWRPLVPWRREGERVIEWEIKEKYS